MDSTKVEMEEAREENRRLKSSLSRIKKEFEILQTQYNQLMVQQPNKFSPKEQHQDKERVSEREELVLLSLGRRLKSPVPSGSMTNKEEKKKDFTREPSDDRNVDDHEKISDQRLSVGFEYTALSNPNEKLEIENNKETASLSMGFEYKALSNPNEKLEIDHNQETTSLEISNSNKIPSENSFGFKNDGDDHEDQEELLPQNLVKKTRVSVRSRCETPTVSTFSSHL